jgi:hypothetical protein
MIDTRFGWASARFGRRSPTIPPRPMLPGAGIVDVPRSLGGGEKWGVGDVGDVREHKYSPSDGCHRRPPPYRGNRLSVSTRCDAAFCRGHFYVYEGFG